MFYLFYIDVGKKTNTICVLDLDLVLELINTPCRVRKASIYSEIQIGNHRSMMTDQKTL